MRGKQLIFSDYEQFTALSSAFKQAYRRHQKRSKRERFLAEMEQVIPWQALLDLIEPCYLNDVDPKT